jgi:flagellar export protein FliJ
MKQFKYRLEALRKLKKHREREKQKHFAEALARVQRQKDDLADLAATRRSQLDSQRDRLAGRISVADMLVYSRYLLKLKRDQLTGEGLLGGFEQQAESRRGELVEASKERQIQDKLKQRQLERFNAEIRSLVNKETDEIAISSYRRKTQT